MNTTKIKGYTLRAMVLTGAGKLEMEKSKIDSLNVFPVPDGDTGTNMSLTLASAARAVEKLSQDAELKEVAEAMAYGALMGARGNSGVILSQLLGGFSKAVSEVNEVDAFTLAKAFEKGVEAAYKAVVKPVEGTILTVAREASEKLMKEVCDNTDIVKALEIFLEQGYKTLAMTPEMLPVLKQAGVVDAGGQGFLTVIEGMLVGFKGEKIIGDFTREDKYQPSHSFPGNDFIINEESIKFQYCTEFIIRKNKAINVTADEIKIFLEKKGDCVLVVGTDDIIKIHVHTNNPGLVLEYCCNIGSLYNIKIDNMREQSKELQLSFPNKNLGVISVSTGEGINEIFKSLGVDYIITGGQTMNPSTEDILAAIEGVNANEIIILPNNKNIILAAQQAVSLSSKPAKVVTSKTIPQGISALMAFNGELDLLTNYKRMQDAINQVKTCEVTYAVRDAQHGEMSITTGQIMGIIEGEISIVGEDIEEVISKIMKKMITTNVELVTLYYGYEITKEQAEKLLDKIASFYPNVDFELHYGGQPLYYYLISIE
ncbi:MAG: fatty acid kinase [Clostridia bacterium]|nr:fatty acid kinase [Clostridia bacterium]MDN5323963.1 fatty acid kinase [Clostridia bacterium]